MSWVGVQVACIKIAREPIPEGDNQNESRNLLEVFPWESEAGLTTPPCVIIRLGDLSMIIKKGRSHGCFHSDIAYLVPATTLNQHPSPQTFD